jgi:hypothetical protein
VAGPDRPRCRLAWIDTIGKIEALAPRIVVAGHEAPGAADDDLAELIAGTRQYIIDFDEAERASSSREELVGKMLAAHGDRGNLYTLWTAATAAFSAMKRVLPTAGGQRDQASELFLSARFSGTEPGRPSSGMMIHAAR